MRIWVQKSASMQKRTSPLKFGDLAEKSGLNSVSNLSTKPRPPARAGRRAGGARKSRAASPRASSGGRTGRSSRA